MLFNSFIELSTSQFLGNPYLLEEEFKYYVEEEQGLEPEIEEFLACLVPLGTQENQAPNYEDLQGTKGEEVQDNYIKRDYIEDWFQSIVRPRYDYVLQLFMMMDQGKLLPLHVYTITQVPFPHKDMHEIFIMLHTWFHWKFSYT